MKLYQLKRKTHIGTGWAKMTLDRDVLFFKNKEDAKALQNTFNGDKVQEVVLNTNSPFIYNIRLIHNAARWGQSFGSLIEATQHCLDADKTHYDREIYKNKIYNSLSEYNTNFSEPERVYEK